jgi:hypothetical protein
VHNLVHHELLKRQGVSFSASRPEQEQESEFLASEDLWFRPTMTVTGPDGALWVVDMYRYMIEHPEWLPPEGKAELAPYFREGEDRGRIYRIYPRGKRPRAVTWPKSMNTAALVAAMENSNGWLRDTVHRELLERKDAAAVESLNKLLKRSKDPRARVHAVCALDALSGAETSHLLTALADGDPAVRRQAVRLCESRGKNAPALRSAVL